MKTNKGRSMPANTTCLAIAVLCSGTYQLANAQSIKKPELDALAAIAKTQPVTDITALLKQAEEATPSLKNGVQAYRSGSALMGESTCLPIRQPFGLYPLQDVKLES